MAVFAAICTSTFVVLAMANGSVGAAEGAPD
jgi:hypothetical protein